jgi:hypothetical protein
MSIKEVNKRKRERKKKSKGETRRKIHKPYFSGFRSLNNCVACG